MKHTATFKAYDKKNYILSCGKLNVFYSFTAVRPISEDEWYLNSIMRLSCAKGHKPSRANKGACVKGCLIPAQISEQKIIKNITNEKTLAASPGEIPATWIQETQGAIDSEQAEELKIWLNNKIAEETSWEKLVQTTSAVRGSQQVMDFMFLRNIRAKWKTFL